MPTEPEEHQRLQQAEDERERVAHHRAELADEHVPGVACEIRANLVRAVDVGCRDRDLALDDSNLAAGQPSHGPGRPARILGVREPERHHVPGELGLEAGRRVVGEHPSTSHHHHPLRVPVGLLEVVRGEEHRGAVPFAQLHGVRCHRFARLCARAGDLRPRAGRTGHVRDVHGDAAHRRRPRRAEERTDGLPRAHGLRSRTRCRGCHVVWLLAPAMVLLGAGPACTPVWSITTAWLLRLTRMRA